MVGMCVALHMVSASDWAYPLILQEPTASATIQSLTSSLQLEGDAEEEGAHAHTHKHHAQDTEHVLWTTSLTLLPTVGSCSKQCLYVGYKMTT